MFLAKDTSNLRWWINDAHDRLRRGNVVLLVLGGRRLRHRDFLRGHLAVSVFAAININTLLYRIILTP